MRILKLGVFWLVCLVLFLVVTGASAASQGTALAICAVVGVILPFILKLVPAAGHWMVLITLAISLIVAVAAEVITGEIVLSQLQSINPGGLFVLFMSVWGLSQVVYATLTQSPSTTPAVQ